MRTIIALLRLALAMAFSIALASSAFAQAQAPIPTAEQRLLIQIANLTGQLAHAGEAFEKLKQQNDELQAQLKAKGETGAAPPPPFAPADKP